MQPIAKSHLLWDAGSGAPVELVVYAIPLRELDRTRTPDGREMTEVAIQMMQWSTSGLAESDTTDVRRLRLPAESRRNDVITGVLLLPGHGAEHWGLHVRQESGKRGGFWITSRPPLESAPVALSDLVLGSEEQSLHTVLGDTLTLGPLDSFDRRKPITLQFQVNSAATASLDGTLRLILAPTTDGVVGDAVLGVGTATKVAHGIAWLRRELDFSVIPKGQYELTVDLVGSDGTRLARRATTLELR